MRATLVLGCAFALLSAGSPAAAANVVLRANLTGTYLHTTSRGSGTATITFEATQVCWKFTYRGLDTPGDSGIHIAPPPAAGVHTPSVFPFTATTSTAPGCVTRNRWGPRGVTYADKIVLEPSRFYVIIGTAKFPRGAIGGLLRRA